MNKPEDQSEENLARLLRVSFRPEAQLTPAKREHFRRELVVVLRTPPPAFPASVLIVLSLLVLLSCVRWGVAGNFGLTTLTSATSVVSLLAIINVVCAPFALLVIIIRKKTCLSA